MMKHLLHWPLLCILILILWTPNKALCLDIRWNLSSGDSISNQTLDEFSQILDKQFLLWESQFRVIPRKTTLILEYLKNRPSESAHEWAWSESGRVFFSEPFVVLLKDPSKIQVVQQILNHELAHQFIFTYSPLFADNVFVQETFAYWITKDYERVIGDFRNHDLDSFFARSSLEYVLDHRGILNRDKRQFRYISRLLAELNKQNNRKSEGPQDDLLNFYCELFKQREIHKSEVVVDKLIEILSNQPIEAVGESHEFGFQIVDGTDQFVLKGVGKTTERKRVGSILKPLLVAKYPEFRKNRKATNHFSWICGQSSKGQLGPQIWGWRLALVKSCNGYFIDNQRWNKSNSDTLLDYLTKIGVPEDLNQVSLGQVVGLVPGIKLSVQELAGIYRILFKEHPEILEALKETAKIGTLSDLPDSPWFVKNEIALKSGTVRNNSHQPQIGWIVAAKGRGPNGPDWVAVYYHDFKSPADMLGGLRKWLADFVDYQSEAAKVQVLGLVDPSRIKLGCPKNRKSLGLDELRVGDQFDCGVQPVEVTFPLKDKTLATRKYFGTFTKSARTDDSYFYESSTVKQRKARRGSALILNTGVSSYVSQVIASEMPNGREELLKALALVIKKNALSHPRHQIGPCDTTHCQVFAANWDGLSEVHRSRILKATLSVNKKRLSSKSEGDPNERDWFPFANGGSAEWVQFSSKVDVQRILDVASFDQIKIDEKKVVFLNKGESFIARDCEKLRTQMHLQSCPTEVSVTDEKVKWVGYGEGHGLGLKLFEGDARAATGENYREILRFFYPGVEVL